MTLLKFKAAAGNLTAAIPAAKKRFVDNCSLFRRSAVLLIAGFRRISRFALKCAFGMLFLLSFVSLDEAKACDPATTCHWFLLKHEAGPNVTVANNLDSYASTRVRYEFLTRADHGTNRLEYLVSERSDGGNWVDSDTVRGTATKSDYADVGINQAVKMQVPRSKLNRAPLGSWYATGPGTHSADNRYTFVPDKDAVNRIQNGHKVEVRIFVKIFYDGSHVRSREYHLTFANVDSSSLSWEANNNPTIISDGSSTYAELDGLITNTPTGNFPLLFGGYEKKPNGERTFATVGSTREITSKFGGWDVPVGDNFKYGSWVISRNGDKFLFRPKSDAINKLWGNQVVVSVLEVTPRDGNGNPATDKSTIKVTIGKIGIVVDWGNDLELDSEGNPIITIDHSSDYTDLHATMDVVKKVGDYYHGGADDYLNGSMKISGSSGPASGDLDADNLPSGFVKADTRVYGRGWSSGSGKHRAGVWFFDGRKDLVAFRPIKERLDELTAGDFVESYLNLKVVRWLGSHTTLVTKTLKVTIKKAEPAKVSINDIELAEGTGSESTEFRFKVSIDSEVAVGESFTVPVAFVHVTTDRFDFPGDTDPTIPDVNFGPGDTEQIVSILVKRDSDKEFDETFTLRLSEPTGNAKDSNLVKLDTDLGASVGTGTIFDDDKAQISISDDNNQEGNGSGSTEFEFIVSLSPATALNQTFTVPVTFTHLSTDRDDFVSDPEQIDFDVSFGASDTSQSISIMVTEDTLGEDDERFTLTLSEPTGDAKTMNLVTLSSVTDETVGLGTINNDDMNGTTLTWAPEFEGAIVSNSISGQYKYKVAHLTDDTNFDVEFHAVEIKNDNVINEIEFSSYANRPEANLNLALYPEFTGSTSSTYKFEDNFQYGRWYIRQANGCGKAYCDNMLFVPNNNAINQLDSGDIVKSTVSYSLINSSDAVVETTSLTVTITVDYNTNGIGFDIDNRRIEAGESEAAKLVVYLPEGLSGPVTIPFSISDGTAKYPVDFRNPPNSSLTIPAGETRGTISIPLVDDSSHEGEETFTVSLGDGTDFAIAPALQTAIVTILDNDPIGNALPSGRECHDVAQPSSVTTPNTRAYWETPAAKLYYAPHEKIDVRMGFKEEVRIATDFNYGAFFGDGNPENADLSEPAAIGSTGEDFQIGRPGNHRGKFQYAILPSSETDNKWYHIDAPCVFHVWWTDGNRPGITLSIEQDTVAEGRSFRVKATATPAPNRDLLIPVFLSDESRIEDSQTYDILIEARQTSGFKDIHTSFMSGDQTADEVVASTEWRSSYWLDSSDAVKSDTVTIQDHDKLLVEFKNSNPNITVSETGNAEFVVKYEGTPSQRVTVKYQIGGDDDTAGTSDFMAATNGEITIPATSNEGTIRISISEDTAHEETEFFTVTLIESDDAVPGDRNSVATVTILSNDRPTEMLPSTSCDAVTQPVGVSTPNTETYWAVIPDVYQESGDNITARMGFRNPSNPTPADFKIGIYYITGRVENTGITETSMANSDHLDFPLTSPRDYTGYLHYRILESDHSDNRWYNIGTPCDFRIWWVDENSPGITLTIDEESVVEGESATITATANPEPNRDLLVPFSISDVSRIEDSQVYNILIKAGQSSGQTPLLTKSMPGDQTADALTVTAEWQSSYLLDEGAASDVISIVEETGVSLISINDLTQAEDDDSGSIEFQFKVSLSPATAVGQTFTVPVAFNHVSTDEFDFVTGQDFSNLDVTFGTGDTEKTIQIFVNDDAAKEPDETFTLTLSEPTGDAKNMNLVTLSSVQGETVGTGTITNDDPATVSIASVTMDEDNETGGNRFLFAVSLSPAVALGQTFTVPITFGKGTTDNDDFVANQDLDNLSAVFGIADTERMVPVVVKLDYDNEPDETFTLTLGEPTGDAKNMNLVTLSGVQNETVATGTIVNNDQATISIDNVTKAEGTGSENTTFEFTVSLSPAEALSQDFSVPLTFKHGSTDPADFVDGSLATLPASVNFAAADALTEDKVEITVKADDMSESDETFTLTLSEPTGAAKDMNLVKLSATASVGTGTITTDDGSVVSIDSLTMEENSGTGGSTLFQFTVKLLPAEALDQPFSVPVAFAHDTTDDTDFVNGSLISLPTSVDFTAGDTSSTIDIMVDWDDDNEGDESFTLTISEPAGPAKDMDLVTLNSTPGGNVGTGRIVNDDQATISINDLIIAEGTGSGSTEFEFKVSLSPPRALNQDFAIPVAVDWGDANADDFVGLTLPTVPANLVFNAADSVSERSIAVPVNWDDIAEPNESFTLTLSEPTGDAKSMNLVKLSSDSSIGTGTIENDDGAVSGITTPPPILMLTSVRDSITEGEDAEFRFECSRPITTRVNFAVVATGDFIFAPVRNYINSCSRQVTFKIPTVDNRIQGDSGSITLTVHDTDAYDLHPSTATISAKVDITDNDHIQANREAPLYSVAAVVIREVLMQIPATETQQSSPATTRPNISISAVNESVEEGELAKYVVSASQSVVQPIRARIILSQSGDFIIGPMQRLVNLDAGQSKTVLDVATEDDERAESDGRITATILAGSEYLVGSQNTAHVTVSDALDRQHRKTSVATAMNAILPDLLAHSTARTLAIASNRITQGFSGSPSTSIELNGKSPAMTALQSSGEALNGNNTDWQSLIDDFSFTVALYPEGSETSPATVWGVGDKWNLSNRGNGGQQSWDGETYSGHFGFDAAVGPGMLAGLAMSVSQSEIGYGQNGGLAVSFDTMATGLHPYLGISTSDGNSRMQIVAGYGENELELKQKEYSPETLNVHYNMVAIGGSRNVYSRDSFGDLHNLELSVAGEAWHSRQYVDSLDGVTDSLQIDARHVHFAIKEAHDHHIGNIGTLSPSLSIGLRGDARNEKSIFGLNVGSGIRYDAFDGIEVLGSGKSLLAGLNRVHRWEIESSLEYDSGSDGKGVLFNVSQSWSGTDANADRYIWGNDLVNFSDEPYVSGDGGRINAEIGYGYDLLNESAVITPYSAFRQTKNHVSEFQVGSRLATNTGINFELEAVRNIPETGTIGLELNLTGNINW